MSAEEIATTTTTSEEQQAEEDLSALRDNIERKGKNAYYFAHAKTANGPKWDGKIEPKLLSTSSRNVSSVSISASMSKLSLMAKSNITNYAFLDDGAKVKIYVNLPGVGNCDDDNITIDFTERSLCLTVKDYAIISPSSSASKEEEAASEEDKGQLIMDSAPETVKEIVEERKEDRCLTFAKLYGDIEKATFKKKPDKVIITLKKKGDSKWNSIIA
uniref:CS domain-containing protein n=1 Tax=Skeletonema marinoi TaxID=267567 RepID=A0A7S2VI87_9STRA|mmetsp:Transcript_9621/g.16369  ORF Transcript_9621/g.16369 Transcript_9621/m.16369 type:complete len:216 (+) Transcript_9621:175-822(+)